MAEWVSDGRDALDRLTADMVSLFADAEQRLSSKLALQVAAGLAEHPEDVARAINVAALRREAEAVAVVLDGLLPDQIDYVLQVALEQGANAAMSEIARLGDVPDVTLPRPAGSPVIEVTVSGGAVTSTVGVAQVKGVLGSSPAAMALRSDLTNVLGDVTRRILRFPDDAYRRAVSQSASDVLLGMATQRTAQARAWQTLVGQGISGFTDSRGREWNLASYVEAATRTATRRAWDVQHEDTYRAQDIELVSIVVGSGACEACSDVGGKIYRVDSGPTGRLKTTDATTGKQITITVAGTLDDARSHGWRHPNCRCRPVAHLPGLPVVSDVTTYDPEAEADRAKLRSLERETRKAKLRAEAAVSPEEKSLAQSRVRDLQSDIREHVKSTGLMRQRNREQINLGNRAPVASAPARSSSSSA